jgi:hypothetical protein
MNKNIKNERDGAISNKLGIGIYAPLAKSDNRAPVESVIVFRQGYYD